MKKIILFNLFCNILVLGFTQTSQQLADSGYAKIKSGKFAEAIILLNKAIELKPDNANALYYMGLAHGNTENYNQAVVYFTSALNIDSTMHDALYNRAASYYYLEKYQKAVEDYTKLIQIDPLYYSAYMKKPISATIDANLIRWMDDILKEGISFRNKSHLIEVALNDMKYKLEQQKSRSREKR